MPDAPTHNQAGGARWCPHCQRYVTGEYHRHDRGGY